MSVVFMVAKTLFGCPLPYNLMAGMTASQPAFHSVLTAKNTQPFNYFQCLCWLRLRPFVLYRIISTFHLILMFYCIRFFSVCLRRMISLCSDWAANRRKYQESFAVSRKDELNAIRLRVTVHSTLIDTSRGVRSRVAEPQKRTEHKENPF